MGEPIRLRGRQTRDSTTRDTSWRGREDVPSRPRYTRITRDHRTGDTSNPSLTHVERALERQEHLQQLGVSVGEHDINLLVSDPEQRKQVVSLLSDREIEEFFGIDDPDEISHIRQSAQLTDVARARVAQALKERQDGTRELEVDRKANLFFRAVGSIVDAIIGEEGSGQRKFIEKTPTGQGFAAALSGLEKGDELWNRLNARSDHWNQTHGYESKEERQTRLTEGGFSWGQGLRSVPLGIAGADEPGKKPWDVKAQVMGHSWNILGLQTTDIAAGIVADLYEMDALGTPEGRKEGYAEFERLYNETGDYNTSMIDSWRGRDDLSWAQKEGIILAADPSIIWGGALALGKGLFGGVKAYQGISSSISAMKAAKSGGISLGDYEQVKRGVEDKIRRGQDDDFWEGKDADLDRHARGILDQDESVLTERRKATTRKLHDMEDSLELREIKLRREVYMGDDLDQLAMEQGSIMSDEDYLMDWARRLRKAIL